MNIRFVSIHRLSWLVILSAVAVLLSPIPSSYAATTLSASPLSWNVIGLDSNDVTVGPNKFPIGARVCNTGAATAAGVSATFNWDSANAYVDVRAGTNTTIAALSNLTSLLFNAASNVDPSTDRITVTAHNLQTGDAILFDNEGNTAPTGLTDGTLYYVIYVDANTIKLASSYANALASTAIDITADGSGANSLTPSFLAALSFDAASAVSAAADTITITAHRLQTGDAVVLYNGGTVPGGLAAGATYYALVVDANTVKLATSYANAQAGTAIDITAAGSGANSLGACADAYFEVEVTRDSSAYDTTRRYHISVSADSGATTGSTSIPRELYVEHLVSQSRNAVTDMKYGKTLASLASVANGGTLTLVKGETYYIQLVGNTATQGYEQIETFSNFPNTIFQVLGVSTTYTADTSPYVDSPLDKLYADACSWINDPNSPVYRACSGVGKAGGNITVTYQVKIINTPSAPLVNPEPLGTLVYDFSGSSFHYNSDFDASARYAVIVDPAGVTIGKNFSPDPIGVDGVSALTFTLTNPYSTTLTDLNFTDTLPASPGAMVVASTPGATTSGCGTPTFSPTAGAASISFSNGSIGPNSSCTIKVNVTAPAIGTYTNNSSNLFMGTIDTGNFASDTLTVNNAPTPPACTPGLELARWTMETSAGTTPPPLFTSKSSLVSTAAASYSGTGTSAIDTANGNTAIYSWGVTSGWAANNTGYPNSGNSPYFEFVLDTSEYTNVGISAYFHVYGNWANSANNFLYLYSWNDDSLISDTPGTFTHLTTVTNFTKNTNDPWSSVSSVAAATGTDKTRFRINAVGQQSSTAELALDDIVFTGCRVLDPPSITKSFSPTPVAVGGTSTLTFTITNPNAETGATLNGISFTDVFPNGLVINSPLTTTNTCGGTLQDSNGNTLDAADTGIKLNAGQLAPGASCTVSIVVQATTAGPHNNVSGIITATESGDNMTSTGYATATLTAVSPPNVSKLFSPNPIVVGSTAALTFTVSNPNQNDALSGIAFSDTYPGGLVNSSTASTTCSGGTASAIVGGNAVSLSGASLAAGASCTVTVSVTSATAGSYSNETGGGTTGISHIINAATVYNTDTTTGKGIARDTLSVTPVHPNVSLLKQVGTTGSGPWWSFLSVGTSSNVYYRFAVENTGDVALNSTSVSDPAPYLSMASCSWTDGDGDALTAPFTLAVPSGSNNDHIAYCTLGAITTNATPGSYPNTATASATPASGSCTPSNPCTDSSTATYANPALSIDKNATDVTYTTTLPNPTYDKVGDKLYYSYVVTNSGEVPLAAPVTVADNKTTVTCPLVTSVGDNDGYLDPNEQVTCTSLYEIVWNDTTAGSVTNIASATVDSVSSGTDTVTALYNYPTYSLISSFRAYIENGKTVVAWSTAEEHGTLGFFIERQDAASGAWLPLNNGQMLPGLIIAAEGGDYRLDDPGASAGQVVSYRLIEREVSGSNRYYGPWRVMVGSAASTYAAIADGAGESGAWQTMGRGYSARIRRLSKPAQADIAARETQQAQRHAESFNVAIQSASSASAIRLRTGAEGLYRINAAQLSDFAAVLGVTNRSLGGLLTSGMLRLESSDGVTPYYYDSDSGDAYFVANAYQTLETQENTYRLSAASGSVMPAVSGKTPSTAVPGVFRDIRRFEENKPSYLLPWVHGDENADYWYWTYLYPPYIRSAALTLQLPDPAPSGQGVLKIFLRGGSNLVSGNDRQATVSLNGVLLQGSVSWDGNTAAVLEAPFDQAGLGAAVDGLVPLNVQVNGKTLSGAAYDLFLIDRVEVQYDRKMHARQGGIWLRQAAAEMNAIDGFGSKDIKLIENPGTAQAKWRKDVKISAAAGGGWQISFKAVKNADYLAAEAAAAPQMEADTPSALKSADHNVDYLIIAPEQLAKTAAALAEYRKRNFKVEVVALQDIYDEFNAGRTSSRAVEAFLDYVAAQWTHVPHYVVLLGRGTLDHRDLMGYHESLVPFRLAATPWGLVGSDNRYSDTDGDHLSDFALGRIAASTEEEGLAYVNKLIAYEAVFPDAWVSNIALIADNPDIAGNFHAGSDQIGNLVQSYAQGYTLTKLYHPQVDVRAKLFNGWNNGYGYVNYIGHGASTQLAVEAFMKSTDVNAATLHNGTKLPIFAALTCAVGDSMRPGVLSLSDKLVLHAEGGAIAAFSPTGLSLDAQAVPLNKYFVGGLLGNHETIGTAALIAHERGASEDEIDVFMHDIYQISGDPAIMLH